MAVIKIHSRGSYYIIQNISVEHTGHSNSEAESNTIVRVQYLYITAAMEGTKFDSGYENDIDSWITTPGTINTVNADYIINVEWQRMRLAQLKHKHNTIYFFLSIKSFTNKFLVNNYMQNIHDLFIYYSLKIKIIIILNFFHLHNIKCISLHKNDFAGVYNI